MISVYSLLLVFALPFQLFGQEQEKASNLFELQYGLHLFYRQDQLFSPMIYHAASPINATLQYENENMHRMHAAEVMFNYYNARWHDEYTYLSGLESLKEFSTFPSGYTVVTVKYNYLRKFKQTDKSAWWIGGMSDNQINSIDNEYGSGSTFGYFAHFSISPMALYKYSINERSSVTLDAYFPLISWVSRSPYAIHDDEYMIINADHNGFKTFFRYVGDGNLHLINRFQQLNFDAAYDYQLSEHWQTGAVYRFEFLRDTRPLTIISYQHYFNIKIGYEF